MLTWTTTFPSALQTLQKPPSSVPASWPRWSDTLWHVVAPGSGDWFELVLGVTKMWNPSLMAPSTVS